MQPHPLARVDVADLQAFVLTEIEVNPPGGAAHPFVSPDETILLFDRFVGPNDTNGDLFVSFRLADGSWSEAQAVEVVNTDQTELAASLSPDGSILVFARGCTSTGLTRASSTRTARRAASAFAGPRDGRNLVWCVSLKLLKP